MKNQSLLIFLCTVFAILITQVPMVSADNYQYVTQWGSSLDRPHGIALDKNSNVYVASTFNNQIQVFDSSGTYITQWGSSGSADGTFTLPVGISVNNTGYVYVADRNNNRVQVFNSSGSYINQWGSSGTGDGQFGFPVGLAINSTGYVYVVDGSNNRIQVFDPSGAYITQWGSYGTGNGQFNDPYGIAIDSMDTVFVIEVQNSRVQKFDSSGAFITKWGSSGTGDGQFSAPYGIEVDNSGLVYVADTHNGRIQVFDSFGTYITQWSSSFNRPVDLAVNKTGYVYVADTYNSKIKVFSLNPPTTDYTGTPRAGPVPLTVTFNDTSTGSGISSFYWSLGDGFTTVERNFTHTYTASGIYDVKHSATNNGGTTWKNDTAYITVNEAPPVVDFTGNPTNGTVPLHVQFNDNTINSPDGWAWYFGDENFTGSWTLVNESPGWSPRDGHTSVILPDGTIVLMGGNDGNRQSDVWTSTDKGATWTQVNWGTGWLARFGHSSVALPDSSIVLTGGNTGGDVNSVHRSVDKGKTWTLMTASAEWSAREGHSTVAMPDGSIILMGGYAGAVTNEVWKSVDNGTTWTEVNHSAGWPARYHHSANMLPDDSIVIMGGLGNLGRMNDVWRSTDNGITWTEVTGSAGWSGRYAHSSVVMPDGSIILTGGFANGPEYKKDVWRSTDRGATWTEVNVDPGWSERSSQTSVVTPDGSIILMGGSHSDEVWQLMPAGSTIQNPDHTYTNPGTYQVALQAYNTAGYNSTRKTGYITVNSAALPVISYVMPNTGARGGMVTITDLHGTGFQTGLRVNLTKSGQSNLTTGNITVISATQVNCTITIPAGTMTGLWNVTLTNPDGQSGTLEEGFTIIPAQVANSRIGVFRNGFWILDGNGNFQWDGTGAGMDIAAGFGMTGDNPVVGNWNHTTTNDKIGVFRNGSWFIDYNGNFLWDDIDRIASLGEAGDIPVTGDWNRNTDEKIGVFRNGFWMLDKNGNFQWDGPDPGADVVAGFGMNGDIPVVADWNNDVQDNIGLFRNGFWILDYNGNYRWDGEPGDKVAGFGMSGDVPLARDWNGDSIPEIAIFRPSAAMFIIDYNGNFQWDGTGTGGDIIATLGQSGDVAVAGDWDSTNIDKMAVFRDGFWIIDDNGNFLWDGPPVDKVAGFGTTADLPVTGAWS
jgi:PKD repeat protein